MKLKYVLRQIKPADRYPSVVRSLRDVPTDDTLIEAAQDEAVYNIASLASRSSATDFKYGHAIFVNIIIRAVHRPCTDRIAASGRCG